MQNIADIAHIIELAVAPVFLLAGIGAFLNVMTSRLARVIDRARRLEEQLLASPADKAATRVRSDLQSLDRRLVLSQRAIYLCALAALLVCLLVAALFLGEAAHLYLGALVGTLFVGAMICLVGGLGCFLIEISIATKSLRVRSELLEHKD